MQEESGIRVRVTNSHRPGSDERPGSAAERFAAEAARATRIARGLQEEKFTAIVSESGPGSDLLKPTGADAPRYRPAGQRIDFEAGQSKGWEAGGAAVSMRNSSLFAYHGEHSLEV